MKRTDAAFWVLAASLVLVGGVHCGATTTIGDPGLAATLRLSELTSGQIDAFCAWQSASAATCATDAGMPTDAGVSGMTALDACRETFPALPDCTVGAYQACHEEALRDPCGAAFSTACQALGTCSTQGRVSPSNGGWGKDGRADIVCAVEMVTGVGAIVWAVRRAEDEYHAKTTPPGGEVLLYCHDYSVVCDHYNWEKRCICRSSEYGLSCTGG